MSLEEQRKLLLPFLQRAEEVQKAEPKIAYYCRLYAVEQALQIPKEERLPEITGLLGALLAKLEKDRASLALSKDDSLYCENFALTVFNRADRVDRAGRADKNTALTFYAASYFMEILNQFGELQPDVAARQRYAAWRAAEIRKALKEGRAPAPPPAAARPEGEVSQEDRELMDSLAPAPSGGISPAPSGGIAPASSAPNQPPELPSPPPELPSVGSGRPPLGSPERLPSPPKRQLSLRGSGGGAAAWVAPPPRTFHQFQKVLYFGEDSIGAPQPGTVAKIDEAGGAGGEGGPVYFVALKGTPKHPEEAWMYRIVQADVTQLALALGQRDAVVYHAPGGERLNAAIEQVDTSHWPPSYLIRTEEGKYVETIDDRLEPLHQELQPDAELEQLQAQQAAQQAQQAAAAASAPPPPPAPPAQPQHPPEEPRAGPAYPPPSFLTSASSSGSAGLPAAAPLPPPLSSSPPAAPSGAAAYPPPPPPAAPHAAPPAYPPPPFAAGGGGGYPSGAAAAAPPPAPAPAKREPLYPAAAAPPAAPARAAPAPAAAAAPPAATPAAALPQAVPGYEPSLATLTEAQKQCKTAMSALSFEDVPAAVKHLTEALRMLTRPEAAAPAPGARR